MNTSQRQHASAGRQDILISRCRVDEEVFPRQAPPADGTTMPLQAEEAAPIPIYFSPNIPDSLALLCNGASQELSVKGKPGKKR